MTLRAISSSLPGDLVELRLYHERRGCDSSRASYSRAVGCDAVSVSGMRHIPKSKAYRTISSEGTRCVNGIPVDMGDWVVDPDPGFTERGAQLPSPRLPNHKSTRKLSGARVRAKHSAKTGSCALKLLSSIEPHLCIPGMIEVPTDIDNCPD
jgi:hypothetical protein